jgi:hypothetical protein
MHNATVYYGQNWPTKTGHEFCDTEYGVKTGMKNLKAVS